MKACRKSEVRTGVGTILFCKNTENAVKKNNSPRFTAFTAKRCKKYAVKIIFFHRISPHFLRKFTTKPRPGNVGSHRPPMTILKLISDTPARMEPMPTMYRSPISILLQLIHASDPLIEFSKLIPTAEGVRIDGEKYYDY